MDMEKNNDERQARRPRRSKADIENAIEKAAIAQIKKKGFARSQVTDIVKRAKIEPIVFYNRYKNLEEFYEGFVKRYDYWLSDLGKGKRRQAADSGTNAEAMRTLLDGLLDNAIVAELLRWEIARGMSYNPTHSGNPRDRFHGLHRPPDGRHIRREAYGSKSNLRSCHCRLILYCTAQRPCPFRRLRHQRRRGPRRNRESAGENRRNHSELLTPRISAKTLVEIRKALEREQHGKRRTRLAVDHHFCLHSIGMDHQ